jgi:hypothetical protein
MLYSIGKYIFLISYCLTENRQYIISAYSLYDLIKFTFHATNKIGLIDYIKKKIIADNGEKLVLILENVKCEIVDNKIFNDRIIDLNEEDYIKITKL